MTDYKAALRAELAPRPQRLARAMMIAFLCALVVLASKVLSLPETALSAYLIFFVSKEDAGVSAATALTLIMAAFVMITLVVLLIMFSAGEPFIRILIMFAVAFGSMYLASATSAGVIAATLGMVLFELLSLLDYMPNPDLLLRGIFWVLPVVIVPMILLVTINLLFGRSALDLLNQRLSHRLKLIAQAMSKTEQNNLQECRKEILGGDVQLSELAHSAVTTGRLSKKTSTKLHRLQDVTMRLLARCVAGDPPHSNPENRSSLDFDEKPKHPASDALLQQLRQENSHDVLPEIVQSKHSVENKESLRFAVKATLSIAICYAILICTHWPAAHTITITAFLVSLGTTEQTLHKAALRLSGCLVGAVISFFCLIVIIPHLSNAAELAILTAAVAFPAAWIAVGSENTAYFGMQIAMVFFLSVLNSSGPSVDLGIAWGRIAGIILGNVVVAGVFISLWPRSSLGSVEKSLNRAITCLKQACQNDTGQGIWLSGACDSLLKAGAALSKVRAQGGVAQLGKKKVTCLSQIHTQLENLAVSVAIPSDTRLDELTQLQKRLEINSANALSTSEAL